MGTKHKKPMVLLVLALLSLALAGCWDLWEIDDRGIVMAIGIEEIPPEEVVQTRGLERQLIRSTNERALKITYQFAVPSGLAGEGSSGGPAYVNLGTTALSSEVRLRGLISTQSSRKGDLTHLQAVVLGPEVCKNGIYCVLERFIRDPGVRRQISIFVTEDDVAQVLDVNNPQEPMPALYLVSLTDNEDWANRMPPDMQLGEISRRIRENAVYVVPRVAAGENSLKMAGGGIFHGDRLVGWLGELETNAYRWIIGEVDTAPILVAAPGSKGPRRTEGYLAENTQSIRSVEIVDGQIKLKVKISTEGTLVERQIKEVVWSNEALAEVKKALANRVSMNTKVLIKKAQEEWRLDLFGFGREVEKKYPQLWKEIKDEWNNLYFPGALVEVDVDVIINRTGTKR